MVTTPPGLAVTGAAPGPTGVASYGWVVAEVVEVVAVGVGGTGAEPGRVVGVTPGLGLAGLGAVTPPVAGGAVVLEVGGGVVGGGVVGAGVAGVGVAGGAAVSRAASWVESTTSAAGVAVAAGVP
jgi:hypothetical protein